MFRSGQNITNKLFSLDNQVMRVFSLIFDLVVLNLLFIIGSLPLVTVGVSLTAMYSVTLKMAKREHTSVVKEYLAAYKSNLKQGLLFGLIACGLVLFLSIDYYYLQLLFPTSINTVKIALIALSLIGYFIYLYIFPLIARYVYTTKEVYQTAVKLSLSNLPWNLVLISLNVPIIGLVLYSGMTMIITCLLMIVIGFAGHGYLQSVIFRKIFAKYE